MTIIYQEVLAPGKVSFFLTNIMWVTWLTICPDHWLMSPWTIGPEKCYDRPTISADVVSPWRYSSHGLSHAFRAGNEHHLQKNNNFASTHFGETTSSETINWYKLYPKWDASLEICSSRILGSIDLIKITSVWHSLMDLQNQMGFQPPRPWRHGEQSWIYMSRYSNEKRGEKFSQNIHRPIILTTICIICWYGFRISEIQEFWETVDMAIAATESCFSGGGSLPWRIQVTRVGWIWRLLGFSVWRNWGDNKWSSGNMQPGRRKIVKLDHLPTKKCFKPQPRNHYSWRKSPAPPGMYKSRSKIVGQMMYQYSLFHQISSTVASEEPLVFVDPKLWRWACSTMVKWMVKPFIHSQAVTAYKYCCLEFCPFPNSCPPFPHLQKVRNFRTSHCDQKLPNSKAATLNNFVRPWKPIEHRFALSRSGSSPPIQSSFSSAWEMNILSNQPTLTTGGEASEGKQETSWSDWSWETQTLRIFAEQWEVTA